MGTKVTHVYLLVPDQQDAVKYYTEMLGFEVKADEPFPNTTEHRWITVAPPDQEELQIVLQPPEWGSDGDAASRSELIGKYPGFVIHTDNCRRDYEAMKARGVEFTGPIEEMPWGISAMIVDKYGYSHNLLEDLPMEG
jgi:uncharacterized glyoxalase superfamily protein PhnB